MSDQSLSGIILDAYAAAITTTPKNMKRYNERFSGGKEAVVTIQRLAATGTCAVYGMNVCDPWRGNNAPAGPVPAGALQTQTQVFRGDGVTQVFDATGIPYVGISNYNWMVELDAFDRKVAPASQSGVYTGWTIAADAGTGTNLTFGTDTFSGDASTTAFTTKTPAALYFGEGTTYPPSSAALPAYLAPTVSIGGVVQAASTYTLTASTPATTEPGNSVVVVTFNTAPASGSSNVTIAWAPRNGLEFALMYVPSPVTIWAASTQVFKRIITPSYDRIWAVLATSPVATSVYVDAFGKG
jgi:hypothetical protein